MTYLLKLGILCGLLGIVQENGILVFTTVHLLARGCICDQWSHILFFFDRQLFLLVLKFEICLSGTPDIGISDLIQFSTQKLLFPKFQTCLMNHLMSHSGERAQSVHFMWLLICIYVALWRVHFTFCGCYYLCITYFRQFTMGK